MNIKEMMNYAIEQNASDIHIGANQHPMLRINGEITPLSNEILGPEQVTAVLETIMNQQQFKQYQKNSNIDFTFEYKIRFRVNVFDTICGPSCAIRLLPNKIPLLQDLAEIDAFHKLTSLSQGIILITGPTGSGKSTTMASIVDYINNTQQKHILTLEDPVEYIHQSNKSLINQREIGINCKSFAGALHSTLREDPDILVIGELRDKDSMQFALNAAETGHLVIATMHTSSAAQTFNRIIGSFLPEEQQMVRSMLSNSFEAIISQRLAKKKDGSGRVAIFEILLAHPGIRHLIREDKIPQIYSLMQLGSKIGMKVMQASATELLNKEVISEGEFNSLLNIGNIQRQELGFDDTICDSKRWN